jgi:hypothetical protein
MRAIILVAGVGWRLKPQTDSTPKCLLEVGGKSLLLRYLEAFAAVGVPEAVLVVGHLKEQIMAEAARGPADVEVRFVVNEQFTRGNILSLWHARHEFDDDILIMYAPVGVDMMTACAGKTLVWEPGGGRGTMSRIRMDEVNADQVRIQSQYQQKQVAAAAGYIYADCTD